MNGKRAYERLHKIGFVRVGGTSQEYKAAQILIDEITALHQKASLETFEVNAQAITNVSLEITSPVHKTYEVTGYGYSGSTPPEGIEAEFYYMESAGNDVDQLHLKNKIVLVNGYLRKPAYEALLKAGALGFITFSGDIIDTYENSDCDIRELRDSLGKLGRIPGVHMRTIDAQDLVLQKPEKVRLTLVQEHQKGISQNVIAEIKGTEYPEEVIIYTAHYDSVPFSTGVYDNGAGSVTIMEMFEYFLAHAPKRTVRFIWCGCEERGLLGSQAYVKAHEDELKNVKFVINVDVGGCVLGNDLAIITADESLVHVVNFFAKENGFILETKHDIYSSDHIPFVDKGIPAISFLRHGVDNSAHIHNRHDTMKFISADALAHLGNTIEAFSTHIINAQVFPVTPNIPTVIKEKIDQYLGKTEKK